MSECPFSRDAGHILKNNRTMESRSQERVRINVSGKVYVCYKNTLRTFEDSLLANLDESADSYDPSANEFYFDRNPHLFNYILDAYRKGTVHLPKDVCGVNFKLELEFWGLTTKYVSPCCWGALYTAQEDMKTVSTLEQFYCGSTGISLMTGDTISLRTRVWLFLYEPSSSVYAKVSTEAAAFQIWALFISLVIVTSVLVSAVESLPFVYTGRFTEAEMVTRNRMLHLLGWGNNSDIMALAELKINPVIPTIDMVCFSVLTAEMLLCGIFCPNRLTLLKSWIHIAEIACNLSFWASFIIDMHFGHIGSDAVLWLYIYLKYAISLKLVRLFRVAANIPALKIMGLSLVESRTELGVMGLILFILASFFGILIFYVEFPLLDRTIDNVFTAMYWAIITLTTVGYGDYAPTSAGGHVIAGACAVCGILMLAIPIGIIASEFHSFYDHHKYAKKYVEEMAESKKEEKTMSCVSTSGQRKALFNYNKNV